MSFLELPNDSLFEIIRFLNPYEIRNVFRLINQNCANICKNKQIWKELAERHGFKEEEAMKFKNGKEHFFWEEFFEYLEKKEILRKFYLMPTISKKEILDFSKELFNYQPQSTNSIHMKCSFKFFAKFKRTNIFLSELKNDPIYGSMTFYLLIFKKKYRSIAGKKPKMIFSFSERHRIEYLYKEPNHLRIEKYNGEDNKQLKTVIEIKFKKDDLIHSKLLFLFDAIGAKLIPQSKKKNKKTKIKSIKNWKQTDYLNWCNHCNLHCLKPLIQKDLNTFITLDNYLQFLEFSKFQRNMQSFNQYQKLKKLSKLLVFNADEWNVEEKLEKLGIFNKNSKILSNADAITHTFLRDRKLIKSKKNKEEYFFYDIPNKGKVYITIVILNQEKNGFIKSIFPFQKKRPISIQMNQDLVFGVIINRNLFVWDNQELIIPQMSIELNYGENFTRVNNSFLFNCNFAELIALYNSKYSFVKKKDDQTHQNMKSSVDFVEDVLQCTNKSLGNIEKNLREVEESGVLTFRPCNDFKEFFGEKLGLDKTFKTHQELDLYFKELVENCLDFRNVFTDEWNMLSLIDTYFWRSWIGSRETIKEAQPLPAKNKNENNYFNTGCLLRDPRETKCYV